MSKILYIEDTENNRILVMRRLEKKGYQVLTANDAEQGLAVAQRELPDLILMDMGLPGMDGWEATRQLKANPKLRHIPIVALTAHAMQEERDKSLEAGCEDYDIKPFEFPRLLSKIEVLLSRSSTASAEPRNQLSRPA
ncbi:MAG: response regulator [Verrucomicrobiales bacterium]|nr:response regulator [Verrucomicrobiales bacterium]